MNKKNIYLLILAIILYLACFFLFAFIRNNISLEDASKFNMSQKNDKQVINAIMDKKVKLNPKYEENKN